MIGLCWAAAVLMSEPAALPAPTSPSSANMALGTDIAARLLPDGIYQRIMGGSMSKLMDGMVGQMANLPLTGFLKAAGLPETETAKLGQVTTKQIMDIIDPAYEQRMRIMLPVMTAEMGRIMGQFEPQMREGLAQAYATRFTLEQLGEIDRFFRTPTGTAYAQSSMTIATDPAMVQRMQAFMPTLVRAMPAIMQKAGAATAGLPKAKTMQTLSDADRAALAKLLGTTPDKLKTS